MGWKIGATGPLGECIASRRALISRGGHHVHHGLLGLSVMQPSSYFSTAPDWLLQPAGREKWWSGMNPAQISCLVRGFHI